MGLVLFYIKACARKLLSLIGNKDDSESHSTFNTVLKELFLGGSNNIVLLRVLFFIYGNIKFKGFDFIKITATGVLQVYVNDSVYLFYL
ncbi:hypothetical protein, partial [Shewanella sp. BJSY2023SW001]|uniref:hypothetical protein n=1 Tax=Shewanella sp. BJSY2023SW001 TaxID=3392039 RepID=UPI0039B3C498